MEEEVATQGKTDLTWRKQCPESAVRHSSRIMCVDMSRVVRVPPENHGMQRREGIGKRIARERQVVEGSVETQGGKSGERIWRGVILYMLMHCQGKEEESFARRQTAQESRETSVTGLGGFCALLFSPSRSHWFRAIEAYLQGRE